jgi:hypothetical protein
MLAHMPGTLLMKDQLEIDAQMPINVMDKELVLNMDGALELQDQPRVQAIITMKL